EALARIEPGADLRGDRLGKAGGRGAGALLRQRRLPGRHLLGGIGGHRRPQLAPPGRAKTASTARSTQSVERKEMSRSTVRQRTSPGGSAAAATRPAKCSRIRRKACGSARWKL